jgi:DNA modification methylase
MIKEVILKQKRDRYEMHKYWGKKPSVDLSDLINEYSNEGDTVLDPFSGYGVFCCEAYLLNRNVIASDLNPVANFLNAQLLEKNIDLELLKKQWACIRKEFEPFHNKWYEWNVDGETVQLTTILRNKNDVPIKAKYKKNGERSAKEIILNEEDVLEYMEYEKKHTIKDWYPKIKLIENSRISAKKGMDISSLFTKRTLSCHAKLLSLIEKHSIGNEKNLLKVAFTANLANCSKLVPPIKSRGDMAPGAWMTGFYTGNTYLENSVLKYFENRFLKILKGKNDYLDHFSKNSELSNSIKYKNTYQVFQSDVKNLDIKSESIDYIFTDPPYGDAVPYFEQSIIWNSWLKLTPDYKNEIVITDSKIRKKNGKAYEQDINMAFTEINRVLKPNKFFSLTYHSLSGLEWKAITNACIINGFELVDYKWLVQNSFTPRQINRLKSIKGDVLVTLKKSGSAKGIKNNTDSETTEMFKMKIRHWLEVESLDTNEIFLKTMKMIFSEKFIIGNVDLLKILIDNFEFTENKKWSINDEFRIYGT